jgi:hypothetical protein
MSMGELLPNDGLGIQGCTTQNPYELPMTRSVVVLSVPAPHAQVQIADACEVL